MGRVKGSKNKRYQTHCKNGHELSEGNYYLPKRADGSIIQRICKQCHKKWTAETEKTEKQKTYRKSYYAETKNAFWRRYSHLKASAKRYGRECTLSIEEYINWIKLNACSYCGEKLPEAGVGIDRLNNKDGYTKFNVVACCESCNEKKGSLEGVGFKFPRTVYLFLELLNVA